MDSKYLKKNYIEEIYEVLTPLGNKQADEVSTYLVKDTRSGRIAVKKEIDLSLLNIYVALSKLSNQHLVNILDFAEGENCGVIIEEYISGSTLREYLDVVGFLAEQEAVNMVLQLLDALQAVHALGIIHRDITPDNVLVSTDGVVRLIDFDIAREKKAGQQRDTTILGTAGYAAVGSYIWAATLIAVNVGYWDKKLPVIRQFPKPARIVFRIFLWMFLFYLGVCLENYVRYDLLGFNKI